MTPLCLSLSDLNVACWRAHEKLIQLFGRFTGRSRLDQGLVVEPEDPLAFHGSHEQTDDLSVLVAKLGLNHEEREEHEEEVAMERGDSSQLNAAIVLVLPERRRCLSPSQEQTCLLLVQSQHREKENTEVQRAQSFLRDLCVSTFRAQ